jgi:hypothetical protein
LQHLPVVLPTLVLPLMLMLFALLGLGNEGQVLLSLMCTMYIRNTLLLHWLRLQQGLLQLYV